ncbi:MAG TPA: alpha-galactosidase, partial [Candidatus Eisenbergiella merdipullorum]|nr:alpha-galactosidase [Candidatus Eisenbergiella merdipullorum]
YREHPDWCLHVKGRESAPIYGRVVLDLSRPEVCEYIIGSVGRQIEEVGLTYIKWDCNRYFTETADQMQAHRYMLGFYHVLKTLTTKYPDVLFEGCSGGGGRFDAGMLRYMPQTWTSDMTKPEERLYIQHGTSYGYPVVSMASHIGQIEVGKTTKNPYLEFSALAAMGGNLGLEMDLSLLSETEKAQVKGYVETYKKLRHIICQGDFYRLESPFDGPYTTWEYVSRDRSEAVLLAFQTRNGKNGEQHMVWLEGLDEKKRYQWNGRIYTGQELMKAGIFIGQSNHQYDAKLMYFR